jgi:hypothetical protein
MTIEVKLPGETQTEAERRAAEPLLRHGSNLAGRCGAGCQLE